jgi:hypothetical protein
MISAAIKERESVSDFAGAPAQVPSIRAPNVALVPPPAESRPYPVKMAKAILAVTREIGAIAKNGRNDFHKYDYVKWDDILDRVSVLLPQHGLIITPSEISRSLFENEQLMSITYEFIIVNEDGDEWPKRPVWTAIARARDQKGIPDDKAAAKCGTQAEKYFLIHFFKIRTGNPADMPDSDADGGQQTETAAKKPPAPGSAGAQIDPAKPRTIQRGGDASVWTDDYVAALGTVTSIEALGEWQKLNKETLDILDGRYPDQSQRAAAAAQAAVKRIANTQAKQTAPKPPAPGTAAAQVAVVTTMPNPKDDLEGFKAWLDKKLSAIQPGSPEADGYEDAWNDKYAPLIDDLLPHEQEEVLVLYETHYQRLAP